MHPVGSAIRENSFQKKTKTPKTVAIASFLILRFLAFTGGGGEKG